MGLALKKINAYQEGVSKGEFEKAWVDLIDRVQIMDEKISRKADEVVLNLVLSHRQEIEQLQTECLRLQTEINGIKKQQKQIMSQKEENENQIEIRMNWFQRLFNK